MKLRVRNIMISIIKERVIIKYENKEVFSLSFIEIVEIVSTLYTIIDLVFDRK